MRRMRQTRRGRYRLTTYTPTGATVTTTSSEIVAANPRRLALRVRNQGSRPIWLHWGGGEAVADKTCTLLGVEQWSAPSTSPASGVTAICESGTVDVHIDEGGIGQPAEMVVAGGVQVVAGGIDVIAA